MITTHTIPTTTTTARKRSKYLIENGKFGRVCTPLFALVMSKTNLQNFLGRAIYILRETLPQFFTRGLISCSGNVGSCFSPSNSNPSHKAPFHGSDTDSDDPESIYSPYIRLAYTPPLRLPPPFPGTLYVEGTSHFIFSIPT